MLGEHPSDLLGRRRRFKPARHAATPNTRAHVDVEDVSKEPGPGFPARLALESENLGTDIFLAKLNSQGVPVWAKAFGDAAEQLAPRVAVDAQGNVLLGCSGNGQIDFGGGALVSAGGPTGGSDAFIAKLRGNDGSHVWSTRFGDTHIQGITSIASAGSDEIVFTASFDGTVNFGGSDFTNVGPQDVALVRYATPHAN